MFCTQCGVELPVEARFCALCGARTIRTKVRLPEATVNPPQPTEVDAALASLGLDDSSRNDSGAISAVDVPSAPPPKAGESPGPPRQASQGSEGALAARALLIKRTQHLTRTFVALSLAFSVYCLLAERPLAFLVPLPGAVSQDLLTSSVVAVLCESTMTGEISKGSGTILNESGVVLTNAHVIPHDEANLHIDDDGCVITIPDARTGQVKERYWAQPVVYPALSEHYDLAYLRINAAVVDSDGVALGVFPKKFQNFLNSEAYEHACIGTASVQLGDPVRILGYPSSSGLNMTVTEGIASSLLEDGRMLTSAKLDAGNSGGLVVDRRGCFLGVPSAVSEGVYENLGVVISAKQVGEFSVKATSLK